MSGQNRGGGIFPPVLWDNSGPGDVVSHGTPLQAGSRTSPQGGSLCLCSFLGNTFRMIFDSTLSTLVAPHTKVFLLVSAACCPV